MKRLFDIAVGALLAILVLPVVLALALAIAVTMRAWPFFVQTRVGLDGRRFRFPKLRTLALDAPAYATKYEIAAFHRKGLASFLRRSHLDELPQLFLVPIGRLSLVGPRPEMPHLHENLGSFGEIRTSVRPGCVGLWQIGGCADRLIGESPGYDLFYLRHWSVRFDLWLLWRYAALLIGIQGPVELDDVPSWALGAGLAPRGLLEECEIPVADRVGESRVIGESGLPALRPAGG